MTLIKRFFYTINYISIIASLLLYSLYARIFLNYGYNYASRFNDPKEMGMNVHYQLVMPYALVLNMALFLPISFLLLVYLIFKKALHRDTIILCILNIVIFYFVIFSKIGPLTWLAD